ncbi:hypothetical protein [Flavobacterium sp.]|jgi:hypothetical protein|uniref:hypothetical protein n=1 Tax=Flavobacterium sp. TaxID=239 RepID=UPI0037BF1D5F
MNDYKIGKAGCGFIVLAIFAIMFIYEGIDSYFFKDERDLKEKKSTEEIFKNYWNESNLDFFKNYNCKDLTFSQKNTEIKKAFIIESHHQTICNPHKAFKFQYIFPEKKYSSKITDSIIKANVLIWINVIESKEEGQYTDGSIAKRGQLELKFIDISAKKIYKKLIIEFTGEAEPEIKRSRYSKPGDVPFGEFPREEIIKTIKKTLDE